MKKSLILVHDNDVEGKIILDILEGNKNKLEKNQIDYTTYPGSWRTKWNEMKSKLSKFEKNVRDQSLKDYAERFGIKDKEKLKEIEDCFL